MKEVYPGIFLIREKGSLGTIKPPENVYILAGKDGLIYDAGYGKKRTVKYLVEEIGKIRDSYKGQGKDFKLERVIPSHWHPDHSSGLKRLRKYLGVRILLTKKSFNILKKSENFRKHFEYQDIQEEILTIRTWRRRIKFKILRFFWWRFYRRIYGLAFIEDPDEIIENDSDIIINGETWKIFPSPGHASDHISLYNEEKGILFSGDNVLRVITTWLGPPECNIGEYIKSLEIIQNLPNLKLILAAHGSPIENPEVRVAELLRHRNQRTQQIKDLIIENSQKGISPSEIVKILYSNSNLMIQNAARGWICLTLTDLEEQHVIRREIEKKVIKFYPA